MVYSFSSTYKPVTKHQTPIEGFHEEKERAFWGEIVRYQTSLSRTYLRGGPIFYRKLYCKEQINWAKALFIYFVKTEDWGTNYDRPYSYVDCAVAKFRKKLKVSCFEIRAFRESVTVALIVGQSARRQLKWVSQMEIRKNPNWHTYTYSQTDDEIYALCCSLMNAYLEDSLSEEVERLPSIQTKTEIDVCLKLAARYGDAGCAGCTSGMEEEDRIITGYRYRENSEYNDPYDKTAWYDLLRRADDGGSGTYDWFSSLSDEARRDLLILSCEVSRRVRFEKYDKLKNGGSHFFSGARFEWELGKVLAEYTRENVTVSEMGCIDPRPQEIKVKMKNLWESLIFAIILAVVLGSCIKMLSHSQYGDRDPPEDWPYNF